MDWSQYPNFKKEEFICKHTGKIYMHPEFMTVLQAIRTEYAKPMHITSGYRDRKHPIEAKKLTPGEHEKGCAADIKVSGEDAIKLIGIAIKHGIRRIGIQQKGLGRYIHLGMGDQLSKFPPAIWTY